LTQIIRSGLHIFVMCLSVFGSVVPSPSYRTHTPLVQNYAPKHRPSTRPSP